MNKMFIQALIAIAVMSVASVGCSPKEEEQAAEVAEHAEQEKAHEATEATRQMGAEDKTTAEDVKHELADASEAIQRYSADKRDEASKEAKKALDAMDVRMEALESRIRGNWSKMDKAAQEQARETLKDLRKQRIELAERYGGLKNSTADAWDHMKKGFSDAYKSLRTSWEKAEAEYREDKQQEYKEGSGT